jgi:hypothetical protein
LQKEGFAVACAAHEQAWIWPLLPCWTLRHAAPFAALCLPRSAWEYAGVCIAIQAVSALFCAHVLHLLQAGAGRQAQLGHEVRCAITEPRDIGCCIFLRSPPARSSGGCLFCLGKRLLTSSWPADLQVFVQYSCFLVRSDGLRAAVGQRPVLAAGVCRLGGVCCYQMGQGMRLRCLPHNLFSPVLYCCCCCCCRATRCRWSSAPVGSRMPAWVCLWATSWWIW